MRNICGIIPCGRRVREEGAYTCDDESHIQWHKRYQARFKRLSFPGVQRVIRRQNERQHSRAVASEESVPVLRINQGLPALGDTPGDQVRHTFRAKTIYCLQTVQWACGVPIGWGKCYRSESLPQVLGILDNIFPEPPKRPSFLVYDHACDLLRHVVTQDLRGHCGNGESAPPPCPPCPPRLESM